MAKKSNFLDSAIGIFSPMTQLRRENARAAIDRIRKYEGASSGRRTQGWHSEFGGSANAQVGPGLTRVRDRVRDLVRNNPNATKAVSVLKSNIIGTGITSSINMPSKKSANYLRQMWLLWCESLDCDSSGLNNFFGLQALAVGALVESGECIVLRKWRKPSDGYDIPVPMQIQVLEGDYIDTTQTRLLDNGGYCLQGVEYNIRGQRVAYWLFNNHPGEILLNAKLSLIPTRYLAKDVLHLFREDRPGQVRGISWGAPCVIKMHDFDAYEDAALLRQRIASCFAAFVRDIETPSDAMDAAAAMPEKIEAGAIEILPPGKTIEFPNLPQTSNDGHSERVLRSIAVGWGTTYEALTGDYSQVNFSSARMAGIEFGRNLSQWQWLLVIPRMVNPVFRWFCEAAQLVGADTTLARAIWTPPRRELVDPAREIPAIVAGLRGGIQNLPEVIREQGYDFQEHIDEIKKSNEALDAAGIILDSDPRKTMKAGMMQQPAIDELDPNASDEKPAV